MVDTANYDLRGVSVTVVLVIILGCFLVDWSFQATRRRRLLLGDQRSDDSNHEGEQWIPLSFSEAFFMRDLLSPGIESTYECSCDNLQEIIEFLECRSKEIAQHNPWLLGRIRTHGWLRWPSIWVPKLEEREFSSWFEVIHVADIRERPDSMFIPRGEFVVNDFHQPISRLCLLVAPPKKTQRRNRKSTTTRQQVVLALNLSHMIADGCTMYQVWKMINKDYPEIVKPLTVKRVGALADNLPKLLGVNAQRRFMWFLLRSDVGLLDRYIRVALCGQKRRLDETPRLHTCRIVRKEWIEDQKQKHSKSFKKEVPFLSSHDLLTSWFLRQFPHLSAAAIAMDMRSRGPPECPSIPQTCLGNYMCPVILTKEDYQTPVGVRKFVNSNADDSQGEIGKGIRCGLTTAWHTFYEQVELQGCQHLFHSLSKNMFPKATVSHKDYENKSITDGQEPVPDTPVMVIFHVSSEELAVFCATKEPLGDMEPLGEPIPNWEEG